MNSVINYVFQSAFCLLIFYGFYFVFLKRETCFQYNRAYLLVSSVLALSLPLVNFYWLFGSSLWQQAGIIPVIYLPEITFVSEGSGGVARWFDVSLAGILSGIYFTGVVLFLGRFLIQVLAIKRIIANNRCNIKYWKDCYLINTDGKLPTFSFFKYLFWDNSIEFTDQERSQILNHELVHIRQKHSYDIIYFEILGVLFWFNPLIRLYKKSITDTHEFIADNLVLKTVDGYHYGQLIVRQLFKRMDLSMGSYFNKSQAYRRIDMIKMNGKKTRLYKLLMALPLVVSLTLIMGVGVNQGVASDLVYRSFLPPALVESIHKEPYKDLLSSKESPEHASLPSQDTDRPPEIGNIPGKDNDMHDLISPKPGTSIKKTSLVKDEVFTIVEKQPFPKDGMESFYDYVRKRLKYPTEARRKGVEGKVFVQFVVEKDGSLSDVTVIKGIGAGCDEEAKKVIQNAENWIPGRQRGIPVNVRMVIPITFSLG